jgi:hypothetical protein
VPEEPSVTDPPVEVRGELDVMAATLDQAIPPKELDRNLLVATWNLRASGGLTKKWQAEAGDSPKRDFRDLRYIAAIVSRFDVIAIQEVKGPLRALRHLLRVLGPDWGFMLTDVTKGRPATMSGWPFCSIPVGSRPRAWPASSWFRSSRTSRLPRGRSSVSSRAPPTASASSLAARPSSLRPCTSSMGRSPSGQRSSRRSPAGFQTGQSRRRNGTTTCSRSGTSTSTAKAIPSMRPSPRPGLCPRPFGRPAPDDLRHPDEGKLLRSDRLVHRPRQGARAHAQARARRFLRLPLVPLPRDGEGAVLLEALRPPPALGRVLSPRARHVSASERVLHNGRSGPFTLIGAAREPPRGAAYTAAPGRCLAAPKKGDDRRPTIPVNQAVCRPPGGAIGRHVAAPPRSGAPLPTRL